MMMSTTKLTAIANFDDNNDSNGEHDHAENNDEPNDDDEDSPGVYDNHNEKTKAASIFYHDIGDGFNADHSNTGDEHGQLHTNNIVKDDTVRENLTTPNSVYGTI